MKLTFKEKAKLFWDRNKVEILGWLITAGVVTGVGCIGMHLSKKKEQEQKIIEDMVQAMAEAHETEANEAKAKATEALLENRLTEGGYFESRNNNLSDETYPNILVNTVPISSMGQFGQDVLNMLNEEWFGEFGETGVENPFDPATATADVYVDFGHEVWKRNHSEEAEGDSQEKQAS